MHSVHREVFVGIGHDGIPLYILVILGKVRQEDHCEHKLHGKCFSAFLNQV